ncbi:NADH-quinone oxidoreductase subunit NuoK [Ravibacter arvi]|uniref:NADH-quinone oxidoreductase subunit K n=1 Tax=Ravibacter arvi TaxID=2051041 RepID=A0ABP8M1R7_9BACT
MIPVTHFLLVGCTLFSIGLAVAVTKKNAIGVLLGLELMLNAVNLNLVAFSRHDPAHLQGQLFALFVMVVAVCEVAIALAIILRVFDHFKTVDPDQINRLKG